MLPNWEQVKGNIERLLWALIVLAAGRGWFPKELGPDFLALIVLFVGQIWSAYINTQTMLIRSVVNLPADEGKRNVVLTSPALAETMPETNVITNTASKEAIAAAVAEPVKTP